MAVRKRFDRELFNETDAKTRASVSKILEGSEYRVENNPKKMGVDLFLFKGDKHIGFIECEQKRVWSGQFKYDTLQIPERKTKFTALELPTYFIVFDKDFDQYMVVKDSVLLKSEIKEVPNRYVYSGELFYQVPISKIIMNDIKTAINGDK